jgi:uncharacterized phage infection (PIP) family protein YhgE
LQEILAKTRQVDELAAEVASASAEQSQGISQLNTAVTQMDRVTQSNAANAEETASAARELNAQAEELKAAVGELLSLAGGAGHTPVSLPAHPARHQDPPAETKADANGHAGTTKLGFNSAAATVRPANARGPQPLETQSPDLFS